MATGAKSAAALMLLLSLAMWAMPKATANCDPVCSNTSGCPSSDDCSNAAYFLQNLPSDMLCCQTADSNSCTTMAVSSSAALDICGLKGVCIPCAIAATVLANICNTCKGATRDDPVTNVCGSYTDLGVALKVRHA